MPIGAYFKGGGNKVMSNMKKEYGDKKGKSMFYATANAKGMKPVASLEGAHKVLAGKKKGY